MIQALLQGPQPLKQSGCGTPHSGAARGDAVHLLFVFLEQSPDYYLFDSSSMDIHNPVARLATVLTATILKRHNHDT